MRERLKKIIKYSIILLLVGIFYLTWCRITGICMPCLFRLNTGLYCPGCGITRMFIALSEMNFAEAFKCNPVVCILLPVWSILLLDLTRKYISSGKVQLTKLHNLILFLSIACLAVFFLIRNIGNYEKVLNRMRGLFKVMFVGPGLLYYFFIGIFKDCFLKI